MRKQAFSVQMQLSSIIDSTTEQFSLRITKFRSFEEIAKLVILSLTPAPIFRVFLVQCIEYWLYRIVVVKKKVR